MLINLVKSSVPQWWRKWKIDPESISTTRLEAHQKLNSSSNWLAQSSEWNNQWNWLITSSVNLLTEWQTDTDRQTERKSRNVRLVGGANKNNVETEVCTLVSAMLTMCSRRLWEMSRTAVNIVSTWATVTSLLLDTENQSRCTTATLAFYTHTHRVITVTQSAAICNYTSASQTLYLSL